MTSSQGVTRAPRRDRSIVFKMLTNPMGALSIAVISAFVLLGVFADKIAPYDPGLQDFYNTLQPASREHLMGTDALGRDIFSRLIFGTRFSFSGAILALAVAMLLGCTLGLISGYFGGITETFGNWLSNVLQALPGIVVLLAAASVLGPNMYIAMVIFGILMTPAFARLVFVTVRAVRNELYVDAARVSGLSDFKIITRHVLGVVRAPILIQAGIVMSVGITVQAGLQFLGLGDLETPTWGMLLTDAYTHIFDTPIQLLWPSVTIALVTVNFVLFANALRDEMQRVGPRPRRVSQKSLDAHVKAASTEEVIRHTEPTRKGDVLLDIKNLEIGYMQNDGDYKVVVHDSSFSINKGEVVGLVGESGSGKTQTALAILGLLPEGGTILDGSIKFDGTELRGLGKVEYRHIRGARISYIPQEPMSNLDPTFTIGTQLVEPIRVVLGLSKVEAKAKALHLLGMVGLPDPQKTFNSYPHEVSGGQAQRVLIAGALSCDPDLIIADEPTTALDVTIQAEILDVLRDLQQQLGVAILLVTHNFGVVADLCDRVVVMQYGRIVETGAILDIFDHPEHQYTKELLGAILDENGPARGAYVAPVGK